MIKTESILISSEVSRDGTQFSIKALEDALAIGAITGKPSCLGHDMTQPIGWIIPYALYFEPNLCRLAGKGFIAENIEDQKTIYEALNRTLYKNYQQDCQPYLTTFSKYLDKFFSGKQRFLSSSLVSCCDPEIVTKVFPSIFQRVDKHGLVYLSELLKHFTYLGHGVFKDKNSELAICAHSYFRKSLSIHNNLNYYFLDQLLSYQDKNDITIRIRIDPDLIGIAETYVPAMEFEYWHGPKFSEDISTIKNEVTVHSMDEHNKIFNGIERTEFYRKIESGEQTFEIEEVKYKPSLGIGSNDFGCRYCHSQFDVLTKKFKHFDGAIRMYSSDQMTQRSAKNLKNAGKESNYTKLFRIDGQLPLQDWQGLIYNYFQGNCLIEEYFTGVPYTLPAFLKPSDDSDLAGTLHTIFPFMFKPEDGIRIAVSYTSPEETDFGEFTHFVIGYDEIDGRKVVEADIIEVKKQLDKVGFSLEIPKQVELVDCRNTKLWNIPEVLLKNGHFVDSYLKAIENLLISSRCRYSTISLNFKWPLNENVIAGISVAGHKDLIIDWLKESQPFPYSHSDLRDWLEIQHEKLSKFNVTIDSPPIFDILHPDGVFYVKRESLNRFIKPNTIKTEKDGLYNFEVKDEYTKLFENLETEINLIPVIIIKKSRCSNCNGDYTICEHSRITDDVDQEIEDFELLGYCLSDRLID